jgi:hypothetical protein
MVKFAGLSDHLAMLPDLICTHQIKKSYKPTTYTQVRKLRTISFLSKLAHT